jgi:hypothetical protein
MTERFIYKIWDMHPDGGEELVHTMEDYAEAVRTCREDLDLIVPRIEQIRVVEGNEISNYDERDIPF